MRKRMSRNPLPRRGWATSVPGADAAVCAGDVAVFGRSRLRMKFLVFRNRRDLHRFWKRGLGFGVLGRDCLGAVSDLTWTVTNYDKSGAASTHEEVDPRYFSVMGLVLGHLGTEVLAHECVHAAGNWVHRTRGRHFVKEARDREDEPLCYATGRIMRNLVTLLRRGGVPGV